MYTDICMCRYCSIKEMSLPINRNICYRLTHLYYMKYIIKTTWQLCVSAYMKPSSGCNFKGP